MAKQEKNREKKNAQLPSKARSEELWHELSMDEEVAESAVNDVVTQSKKHKGIIYKLFWIVLLVAIGFALVNYQYLATWVEYYIFKPQIYTSTDSNQKSTLYEKADPNFLNVPSLEIKAPILYAESKTEKEFQKLLQDGVVHYPGTAMPGEIGNVYIFGHSSDYIWSKGGYKTVFALLPKIEIGEKIKISDKDGEVFTYVVTEKFVAEKTDLKLLSQETGGKKILTLQTSYPIGTALRRYIVRGELSGE